MPVRILYNMPKVFFHDQPYYRFGHLVKLLQMRYSLSRLLTLIIEMRARRNVSQLIQLYLIFILFVFYTVEINTAQSIFFMTIAIFNLDKHCSLVSYKGKVVVLMYIFAFIMVLILTIVPLLLLCSIAEQFIGFLYSLNIKL